MARLTVCEISQKFYHERITNKLSGFIIYNISGMMTKINCDYALIICKKLNTDKLASLCYIQQIFTEINDHHFDYIRVGKIFFLNTT